MPCDSQLTFCHVSSNMERTLNPLQPPHPQGSPLTVHKIDLFCFQVLYDQLCSTPMEAFCLAIFNLSFPVNHQFYHLWSSVISAVMAHLHCRTHRSKLCQLNVIFLQEMPVFIYSHSKKIPGEAVFSFNSTVVWHSH